MSLLTAGKFILTNGGIVANEQEMQSSDWGPPEAVVPIFEEAGFGTPVSGQVQLPGFVAWKIMAAFPVTNELLLPVDGTCEFTQGDNFVVHSIEANLGAGKTLFNTADNLGFKCKGVVFNGDGLCDIFNIVSTRASNPLSFCVIDDCSFDGFAGLGKINGHNQIKLVENNFRDYTSGLELDGNNRTFVHVTSMDKVNSSVVTELTFGDTSGDVDSIECSFTQFSNRDNTTAILIKPGSAIKDGKVVDCFFQANTGSVMFDATGLDEEDPAWNAHSNGVAKDSMTIGNSYNLTQESITVAGAGEWYEVGGTNFSSNNCERLTCGIDGVIEYTGNKPTFLELTYVISLSGTAQKTEARFAKNWSGVISDDGIEESGNFTEIISAASVTLVAIIPVVKGDNVRPIYANLGGSQNFEVDKVQGILKAL